MAIFVRAKHVTAPLDERVRARLRGELTSYASSGSDHDGAAAAAASISDDPSALINGFLDSAADDGDDPYLNKDSDSEIDYSSSPIPTNSAVALAGKLRDLLSPPPSADPIRSMLISDVESAAAAPPLTGPAFRRAVMRRLREKGYNAGICKARWDGGGGGLTAGSYEYIDVVFSPGGEEERRYIVDFGFAAEFEVARPTEEYVMVAAALPAAVVVARAEEIKSAVRIMAEAARRSLKSRGMSVPPWRKKRYMMAKWLGFYRRTVNSFGVGAEMGGEGEVTWRAVGFGCGCGGNLR